MLAKALGIEDTGKAVEGQWSSLGRRCGSERYYTEACLQFTEGERPGHVGEGKLKLFEFVSRRVIFTRATRGLDAAR